MKHILTSILLFAALQSAQGQPAYAEPTFDCRLEADLDRLTIEGLREQRRSPQGMAFSDGVIFALYDKGYCAAIEAATGRLAGEFPLTGAEGTHCNNASFGIERAGEDSRFPVLYVSECHAPSRCLVLDITTAGSRLVQTIRYEGEGIVDFCDWCVDTGRRHLYAFGKTPEGGAVFKRFALPSLAEGMEVVLRSGDVLWEQAYPAGFFHIPQGSCIDGGYIYCPTGEPRAGSCFIHAIDLEDGRQAALHDIDRIGLEPEGTFVLDGRLWVLFGGGNGRIYSFDLAQPEAQKL